MKPKQLSSEREEGKLFLAVAGNTIFVGVMGDVEKCEKGVQIHLAQSLYFSAFSVQPPKGIEPAKQAKISEVPPLSEEDEVFCFWNRKRHFASLVFKIQQMKKAMPGLLPQLETTRLRVREISTQIPGR
jgi:hypothetical protein